MSFNLIYNLGHAIRSGVRFCDTDSTSWIDWWVFPTDNFNATRDVPASYDCAVGAVFANLPVVRQVGTRVLVTQVGGYNI